MEQEFKVIKHKNRVYLDHNATTPVASEIMDKLPEWLAHWGNPSSVHQLGREPKNMIRRSRQAVAKLIDAKPLELIFTSSGSESNNTVIRSVVEHLRLNKKISAEDRNQFVISSVEHPSILQAMDYVKKQGFKVHYVKMLPSGDIDLTHLDSLLTEKVVLVSIMMANNEIGAIYPIKKLAKKVKAVGALFHTDAVQALGKTPLSVKHLGVDFASFSGHKFYSIKGCGVLYVRSGVHIENLIHGGGQERFRRAGTENTLAIASLGLMAEKGHKIIQQSEKVSTLREYTEKKILSKIENVELISVSTKKLPNTMNLYVQGIDAQKLLMSLDMKGISVSAGSACSSGSMDPSHVLLAMGLTPNKAKQCIRVSLGWANTTAEMDYFIETLNSVVTRLRQL